MFSEVRRKDVANVANTHLCTTVCQGPARVFIHGRTQATPPCSCPECGASGEFLSFLWQKCPRERGHTYLLHIPSPLVVDWPNIGEQPGSEWTKSVPMCRTILCMMTAHQVKAPWNSLINMDPEMASSFVRQADIEEHTTTVGLCPEGDHQCAKGSS